MLSVLYTILLWATTITGQDQRPTTSLPSSPAPSSNPSSTPYTPLTGPKTPHLLSPPFYPSPLLPSSSLLPPASSYTTAISLAQSYLLSANFTLAEKIALTTGVGWKGGRCVGNIPAIERVGWKGLCLQDSPLGVRFTDGVSAFPAGINLAATWDVELAYGRGYAMGEEFKGKGVHVALGPGMNLGRVPAGGRNYEMGGADPYLSGEMAHFSIRGIQDAGVQIKRNRTTSSSNLSDRVMHELYLHPFLRSVQADVASVMCSYNLINSSWACQNSMTQNGLLKHELAFRGYVVSDWAATHSGVASVLAGLDMTMPGDVTFESNTTYFGSHLLDAVHNGSIPASRIDDMATRILAGFFLVGQHHSYPDVNFDSFLPNSPTDEHVNVQSDHAELIRKIGAASTVLLKNVNKTLPLRSPRSLVMIGSDAGPARRGPNGFPDRGGVDGTLAMGWGSGTAEFPYLISPLEAIQHRAIKGRTTVNWFLDDFDLPGATAAAAPAEVALVFISAAGGEEYITVDGNMGDRNNLTVWRGGDELVKAVAGVNKNVVVVVHSVGELMMEEWVEHPNVTAIVWAGVPGQESGNSLVDILYGAYNPSAKLPYTIAKNISDYPASIIYVNTDSDPEPQVNYSKGLFIDYRHFLAQNITPRYGFGFGLSYTTFEFSNLTIYRESGERVEDEGEETSPMVWNGSAGEMQRRFGMASGALNKGEGGDGVGRSVAPELHRKRWTVEFELRNTGDVNGCEVPQLYVGFPESSGEPPKMLRGFKRVNLDPGQSQTLQFQLSRYDLSIWDTVRQRWVMPKGADYKIFVGSGPFEAGGLEGVLKWEDILGHWA